VKNPTDDAIVKYINDHNYELEDDKLDAGKATYFLKLVTILVMCIGMLISILSFYIQMLTVGMNGVVLILSLTILFIVRRYYMNMLWVMFPQMQDGSMWPSICLGIGLFIVVSMINIVAVRNRVMKIWNRKE